MESRCLAYVTCGRAGTVWCDPTCSMFMDIRYQVEIASIPKKHQHHIASELPNTYFGVDVFKRFCASIGERVDTGQGLYLFSTQTGTGKSTVACAIALEYIVNKLRTDYKLGVRTPQLVKFVNVPDFLEELRTGFNDFEAAASSALLTDKLKSVPILILDDFGAEKISEWSRERLLTVISERYDNELCTIFTSNIGLQEVEVLLGKRIRSRIEGMTVPIQFKGNDFRRKL